MWRYTQSSNFSVERKTQICINIREMRMTWTESSFIGCAMQIKSDIYEWLQRV
jgi:hypothetical protein